MKIDIKTTYEKNMNNDFIEAVKCVKEKIIPQIPYELNDKKICEIRRNGNLFFVDYNGLRMSFNVKSK